MSTVPARQVGVRFGVPSANACPFVVASLSNSPIVISISPADAAAITVAPAGGDAVLSAIGGQGYVGNSSFTGLVAFTEYTWTATQDGNSESGKFYTAPAAGDDFCFYFGSCDNNLFYSADDEYGQNGAWQIIRNQVEAGEINPCIGVFFVDDYGYVDTISINDGTLSSGNPSNTPTESNYAVSWLAMFGLYDDDPNPAAVGDQAAWPRNENRAWCAHNLNLMPQWGDHEFRQDLGWDWPKDDTANTDPDFLDNWTHGKTCWDAFMGPLQGTGGVLDTTANHWHATLGDVQLLTPDGITNCTAVNGAANPYTDGSEAAVTVQFGNNQIDDLLNAADNAIPFKVWGMPRGVKYMEDSTTQERSRGNQMTIFDHTPGEYQRLFTRTDNGADPESIMENVNTNGKVGASVLLHGDYHNGSVYRHESPAYTNNKGEQFMEINLGSMNGSSGAGRSAFPASTVIGQQSGDGSSTIEYYDPLAGNNAQNTFHACRVDVFGSRYPKELHISLFDRAGVRVWGRKLISGVTGNMGFDIDYVVRAVATGALGDAT